MSFNLSRVWNLWLQGPRRTFRFVPEWRDGVRGGPDRRIVGMASALAPGAIVKVAWYDDHLRIRAMEAVTNAPAVVKKAR
jgi:hypothetical protein